MSRRRGFESILLASAREYSRQQRLAQQALARAQREAIGAARRVQIQEQRRHRYLVASERDRQRQEKADHLADQQERSDQLNVSLEARLQELGSVLSHTLVVDDAIDFESLRILGEWSPSLMPDEFLDEAQPDSRRHFSHLRKPGFLARAFIPGATWRFENRLKHAKEVARSELVEWQTRNAERRAQRSAYEANGERERIAFVETQRTRNAEVDAFESDCRSGVTDSLVSYFSMVLERSDYPEGFPQSFSVALQEESRMLVIRYELPPPTIVPAVSEYRYIRTRDVIEERPRKATETKVLYSDIVAAVVLRTVHEIFESDVWRHLEAVAVNGMVKAVDPATGKDIQPCLVSVRAVREDFEQIDLARVDKAICLRNLGAQVSRNPEEVQAVKPIVEFRMTDPRFVDQADLVSELSSASNLMDLNPYEFEELVANLFGKMGLESKLTRASRDGGVDCVAFDPRPVLGGKVVIQAKRYRHTVGVSAVRDLYGTMMNEGASKGLLVTTSGYGPDAFQFAKDKPIELIDGGGLLYLLSEIGVVARIVMPEEAST